MKNLKYQAKEDTKLYILGKEKRKIFIVPLEKGKKFQLRKGQTFFEGKPKELKKW